MLKGLQIWPPLGDDDNHDLEHNLRVWGYPGLGKVDIEGGTLFQARLYHPKRSQDGTNRWWRLKYIDFYGVGKAESGELVPYSYTIGPI